MGWALITHPEHLALATKGVALVPMLIQERDLHWAYAQDWIVLGRDSDVFAPVIEVPAQSNPRRVVDKGEDGA